MMTIEPLTKAKKWKTRLSAALMDPEYSQWLPDKQRTFASLVNDVTSREWMTGKRQGWVAMVDGVDSGLIWGRHDGGRFCASISLLKCKKSLHKLNAVRLVLDVIGDVYCIVNSGNRKSLLFSRVCGFSPPVGSLFADNNGVWTEYYEVEKWQ